MQPNGLAAPRLNRLAELMKEEDLWAVRMVIPLEISLDRPLAEKVEVVHTLAIQRLELSVADPLQWPPGTRQPSWGQCV